MGTFVIVWFESEEVMICIFMAFSLKLQVNVKMPRTYVYFVFIHISQIYKVLEKAKNGCHQLDQ